MQKVGKITFARKASAFTINNHDPADMWATQQAKDHRQKLLTLFRNPSKSLTKK